jgi:hypothetical protein
MNEQKSNGSLTKVLENLNWPTVVLIAITGGTNFLATKDNGGQIQYQREVVVRQVADLHNALDDFEKRQKLLLDNQNTTIQLNTEILNKIHDIVDKLDRWNQAEPKRQTQ